MGFAETFKALADPARRDILTMLKEGAMSAGEIGSHFDMTGATISYHLNVLKKAELVFEKREKNFIFYELNTSVVEEVMLWLSDLKGGEEDERSKEDDRRRQRADSGDEHSDGTADADRSHTVEPAT
ncbi:MAG: winged helix-turn-helix transcriptional regulator [Lachnospiraceae bacterium]|nr:winged helix-turn-helix transcriptional regulator [Lachnospiraceae bacterium]